MPDPISGVHLQAEQLQSPSILVEIEQFAEWVVDAEFRLLSSDLEKCFDKDREEKLGPLLSAIGFGDEPLYQVLRTTNKKYITGGSAYLVPIRIKPAAQPSISGPGNITTKLQLGTKVFVDKPVYVDKDVYFVLFTRSQV